MIRRTDQRGLGRSHRPAKPPMNPYLDQISLYLECFGFWAVTSENLWAVAALT